MAYNELSDPVIVIWIRLLPKKNQLLLRKVTSRRGKGSKSPFPLFAVEESASLSVINLFIDIGDFHQIHIVSLGAKSNIVIHWFFTMASGLTPIRQGQLERLLETAAVKGFSNEVRLYLYCHLLVGQGPGGAVGPIGSVPPDMVFFPIGSDLHWGKLSL